MSAPCRHPILCLAQWLGWLARGARSIGPGTERMIRMSGNVPCEICGLPWRLHQHAPDVDQDGHPFLRWAGDG